jgi:ABC-type proline/glycine betaine transport system permease subunit
LDDTRMILEGALPAALMALAVQAGFDGIERLWGADKVRTVAR